MTKRTLTLGKNDEAYVKFYEILTILITEHANSMASEGAEALFYDVQTYRDLATYTFSWGVFREQENGEKVELKPDVRLIVMDCVPKEIEVRNAKCEKLFLETLGKRNTMLRDEIEKSLDSRILTLN